MKGLVNFVIKNKLAVWLLTIIITVSGIYSGTKMKMETIPDISIPFLMVMDVYPGATPEQVMEDVSIPLEQAVESLENVKSVFSNSYSNVASLQVEYEYGIDMDEAKRELESALASVNLPEGAQEPTVTAISMNMMPVVALSASSETEDIVQLSSTVEEILLPKIQKIEGVASANITGQHIEEVELSYNEERMAELGLTNEDVKQMIQASDMAVSLGLFEFEEGEEAVAIDGKFMTADELKEMLIPVTSENSQVPFVRLGDIASIEVVGKVQSISRTNGADAIAIQIVKGQQANTVDVVNDVKELIEEEQKNIDGLVIDVTLDQGEPIEKSVATMVEKALFGGLIAILIILLFLRDIKSTIISIVSIPVSIFMALLLLNWMGITLNIMTLGAITVAIGRVIDDSIVVVENIYRRLHLKEEKLSGRALVREATIEMFKPILSSTLVTVAVFAPLIFVGGMVGELFMPFALTMTFALGASLFVAVTIVPALSHFLFRKKLYSEKKENNHHKEVGKLATWYKGILSWTLNHKIITSLVSVALLVGSLALTPIIGFSFMGSEEEKVMYLTYTPEAGELMEDTLANVEIVENEMMKNENIDIVQLSVAEGGDPMSSMMGGGSDGVLMYLIFDPDMDNFQEVRDEVEDYVFNIGQSGEWQSQNFGATSMVSNELSYTFYSEDLDRLNEAVALVEDVMAENDGLKDVSSSAEDAYVEHTFNVAQDELLQYGLTAGQIAMMLSPQSEEVLTTVENNGESIDVIVQQEEAAQANNIDDILATPIPTAMGTTIPLSELVTVETGTTLSTLARSKGEYHASVTGTVIGDDISKATADTDAALEELELPQGVSMEVGGVAADMNETFTQLGLAMLAAIAIVYFILVVTFGEGVAPFAILFSLPFAVIGAFVGLLIGGETISVPVMMGLLMLIGIVVTNAIVLVDRIIHMERDGMTMREAILEAGSTRLRPILMTAIATIGALVPLAIGSGGGGGLISKGLGITVIGGLTSSTLLTLIIVPIVYEVLSKLFKKNRKTIEEN
ncbi:efflux RND transporter permease subunit [Sutcliffiella deserti]|uniref:efflux RND transporter permease subunit n=1 Tax=Sutcliffiella deserti TaxID=2875501 RepID=UPI001CBFA68E|nr:efflux RND transporter permease subunit [Sutcliffiella deserti]